MVMDILRSHHITRTRLLRDSDRETWIRWYPTSPGARAYPGWHCTGDPTWEDEPDQFEGPGCFRRDWRWRPKRYPAEPGQHAHGEPDWYEHGLPAAELLRPPPDDKCGRPTNPTAGGVVLDGSSWPPRAIRGCGLPMCYHPAITRPSPICGCGWPASSHGELPPGRHTICGCGWPGDSHLALPAGAVCLCTQPSTPVYSPLDPPYIPWYAGITVRPYLVLPRWGKVYVAGYDPAIPAWTLTLPDGTTWRIMRAVNALSPTGYEWDLRYYDGSDVSQAVCMWVPFSPSIPDYTWFVQPGGTRLDYVTISANQE